MNKMTKLAQDFGTQLGTISPPPAISRMNAGDPTGATGVNTFLSTLISLFFTFSAIVFVFMVLWAAFDYIMSYGEKENINKARQKLTWAIVGFVILSLSFVLFKIVSYVTGVNIIIAPPNLLPGATT